MELKDRIKNIKTILPYCSKWSNAVDIVDEEVGKFFSEFFKSDEKRFTRPNYDRVFPRINWSSYYGTVRIGYCYDSDRDGEYWETYEFNDPNIEPSKLAPQSMLIEYSEVPDNIWAIIQDKLYENAMRTVQSDLAAATKEVDRCTNKFIEFNKLEINKDE